MYKATEVVTSRPASTSLLTIDSEDRFQDYVQERADTTQLNYNFSPYNFTINKSESMMNGFITRVGVSEVVFPWNVGNVNSNSDTMIVNAYSGSSPTFTLTGTYTITITHGFYTPVELATAVASAVQGANATLSNFTIQYGLNNSANFYYQLTPTGGKSTAISFAPVTTQPASTKQLFDLLGFDNRQFLPANGVYGQITLCQYTRYIDIVSPQLTYNQPLKDTSSQPIVRDSLCRVYLDQITGAFNTNVSLPSSASFVPTGCRPFVIYHNYTLPKMINWLPNQPIPGQLTFQVYDDSGALLQYTQQDFGNSTNWSMSLLVTEN